MKISLEIKVNTDDFAVNRVVDYLGTVLNHSTARNTGVAVTLTDTRIEPRISTLTYDVCSYDIDEMHVFTTISLIYHTISKFISKLSDDIKLGYRVYVSNISMYNNLYHSFE